MKTYVVKVPIAGHLTFVVDAESKEDAIAKSKELTSDQGALEWEELTQFHKGNVCYCPTPWQIEAKEDE